MEQEKIWVIISTIIVTAALAGGIVYGMQRNRVNDIQGQMKVLEEKISLMEDKENEDPEDIFLELDDEFVEGNNKENNGEDENDSSIVNNELNFDLCELPLDNVEDYRWHGIFDENNPEPECSKQQKQIINQESIIHEVQAVAYNGFVYFLDVEDVDFVKGKFSLKKGKLKDEKYFRDQMELLNGKDRLTAEEYFQQLKEIIVLECIDSSYGIETLKTYQGREVVDTPNRGLKIVNGKICWGFDTGDFSTFYYDGKDLRDSYPNLDKFYKLGEINNKAAFIAEKNNKYYIVYDGEIVNQSFDEISVGECCANFAPEWYGEKLFFRARIGDKGYSVIVSKI